MTTTRHRCIWCLAEKPEEAFNTEHVMPQAFGTFEQNFTLRNVVCAACNSLFANELEPWLTRDSLEGFDRYRFELKSPTEFKSQGKRSTTRAQLTEGPYAGAHCFTVPGAERLGVRPFPQMGFARTADGPFEWFMLDELPTLEDLKAKGFSGQCHLRLCECDEAEARVLLSGKGFAADFFESFDPPSGGIWVEHIFRPQLHHRRALAKISMNYLAHQLGAEVALQPRFNEIRRLVMEDVEPSYQYYFIDEHPIIEGDKQRGQRYFGHALLVKHRADGVEIEGVVSLFNRFRHGLRLAWRPGTRIESRGHFFDIGNRRILPMFQPW